MVNKEAECQKDLVGLSPDSLTVLSEQVLFELLIAKRYNNV